MKNLFKSLVVGALLLGSVGCSDMFKEDLYEINNEIDKINQRIDSLCNAVNTNIASLQTIIDVMQDNDYVDSITPIVEGGETVGYEIVFTQSGSVKIYHGKKGETGATGHTPVIGVKQAEDGRWYWTVDGAYLLDGEGDKILAEAIDGEDGATGADGITPQLKVEGDYWYISYDNKVTWERLGKATGEAGKDGDSMFQSVNYNDEYVELVLIDGTVLRIPTWASHMLLVDEIAKINSNISAIQAAVKALESNDYVQKVTPVKDEDGNVIGYTLQFAFAGDVTIFHGEDGKDGEDGEDGKDGEDGEDGKDGYTPVIGARQHPDGNWYWTVDTEWLLDTNGNKVKTTGEDGTSGITPELKIIDDYWYISYDNWTTSTKLGKAKGEDGAAGSAGTAGDAFFKGVDTSDEYYVKFTLADGTVIKIPTWKAYQELADLVDQLNTNFKSLNDIVVGIQNNDYITGYTPIVDPQTNEEIGYTLHFKKSGDITIYHGKTGQDGVAPDISIQEHPKYGLCWTYNGEFIIDPGTGKPVALPSDGKNGKDGVSPKLKIEDGEWWVSYNNGTSWTNLGQATGDTGATGGSGDSFFKSIVPEYATDANGNVLKDELGRPIVAYIVMTLAGENEGDEVTYKVPTEYVTSELNKRIAALETQFTAIETIVKAIQNAEYIKSVVEQYDGPALVGYKITFIKYTIENGTLIPSERDVYIGSASNAGSKVEYAKDENGDYYWVIDGSPLKDEDGNILYIEGKTPTVEINKDGYWVINGVNTGVKAEGKDGANGSNGSNASSLFSDVVLDGSYYVFTFTDGRDPIKVPSWKAFEDLQKAVTQLTATVESFTELIQGNKYIEKVEALSENKGYTLFVKEFNADTQTWDTKSYTIYNGTDGSNGTTPVVPTISVAQDPENPEDQNYYWKVGDNWLTDAQGNKIRANALDGDPGLDALTPEFRIVNGTLYYKYTNEGDDKWRELANVQGSSAAVNIIFQNPANPLESEWIEIRFGEGENDKIKIPTWVAYEKIQDTISSLTTNVEAISALVYGHKYVESFKELENGGYEFVVRYYDENAKEWKTEVHTIDITTADEIGVKQDETDNNYYWTKGGEWLLDAAGNRVMVDGSAERILEFDSKNDGKLYYKYSDETEWTVLDIAVSESVVDSNVVVKEEDGKVTVTVLDDTGKVLYSFSAPSWAAFEALQGRVIALEEQVTDINSLIDQLTTNYEALSGDVKKMEAKLAKCKFIGEYEYDEERKGHVIYLVDIDGNKLQNAAGEYETIFVADGKDGENFDASMLSFTEVNGEYFWTYNGEMLVDAAGKPVKAHGADGRTPEFDLIDDELVYRYEGDEEWISLGNVKGSAAAANITVDPSEIPMWIEIEYSYIDEDGKESVSKIKVPTYHAYEMAVQEIEAIQSNIDLVEEFLNKGKFVADYELEYDENGMVVGCTMTTVEYQLKEDGTYRVIESTAEFNPSRTMHLEVDENEGVWYLVGYKKNEDGSIEEVRRPLSQSAFTFVPKIAVSNGYIYLAKVSVPGTDYSNTDKWDCLGAVVELLGGETQGALKSVEEVDGYICFTFSNGDVLKVPSDAKFQEVLDRLDDVEGAVETIQGTITEIKGSLESLSEQIAALEGVQGNYLTSAEFELWKNDARFVQNVTKNGDDWTFVVADGNGNPVKDAAFTVSVEHPISVTTKENGDLYWVINGKEYPVESKPKFQVDPVSGNLQFSIDGSDWTTLESASNAVKVVFTNDPYPTEGEWVEVAAADALWAGIYYSEENIIWMPTYLNFKNIEGRLAKVEGDVVAIQESIATINGSLASLSEKITALEGVQGNYLTSAEFQAWKDGARFVQNVTKNGDVWSFVVADGNGKAIEGAGFDITATHHVSTYEKDGDLYWVINGKETDYPVETKPHFQVDGSGRLMFTFDDPKSATAEWTTLESASNAVKVVFTDNPYPAEGKWVAADAATALWAGIYYSEENIIWMPTYLNFKNIEGRLAKVEGDVVAIQGSIATINGSLASLSEQIAALEGVQGNYLTSEAFQAWKDGARFVQNVTKNGDVWSFEVADGNGKAIEEAGFDITATPDVSTYEKDGVLYWVIKGKVTEYPVETKPKFRVTAGNLEFSFDGKEWTALESASNATVTVKFATAIAEDGTYTSCDAKDALWAGIYYSEENIIWMPTYKNFNELVAKVEAIDNSVDALIAIVEENAVITNIVPSENGIGFTATAVKYELNYDEEGNLVKGTDGKYYKVTETTEITYADTAVSIEQDPQTNKWYWVVNGAKTELMMGTGFVPQVHTADGYVYVSIAADATTDNLEKGWVKIAQTNTVVTYKGTAETGYTIDFGGDQNPITVPSIEMFEAVLKRVSALEESVGTINTLLTTEFKQFVKSVEEIKSEGQLVGIKVVTAEYKNNAWEDKTSYYYDNALVVPKNDNGVWNWHIYQVVMKDDKGNFTYTELTTIPIDGTFVPQIKYESGAIYVSTPTSTSDLSTWQKLGNFADVQLGGTSQPTLNVTQDDTSVTFTFGSNNIQVAKYFQTPVITFGTEGTLDLGTASSATVTCTITGSFTSAPVIYTNCEGNFTSTASAVTGSGNTYTATITVRPTTAYAGDDMSGKLTVYCPYYGNTGIGQINLKATGAGGLVLQSTNIEPLTILEKPANNATASITFRMEGEDAPPSNRLPVIIDNNYTLTDVQSVVTNNGTKDVETGSGFSQNLDYEGNAGWITLGAFEYEATTNEFTQHFTLYDNESKTNPRTGAVVVFSPSGREVARFVIKQEADVVDNTPVINLVETNGNKAANCYIITDPGRYQIDTYMGAYNTDISSRPKCTGTPEVIWNEGGNTINPCQVGFSDNKLIFDIEGTIKPGNAIIGIRNPKDENDILWSWHLWFCTKVEDPRLEENTDKYPDVTNVYVMNRALGAVARDERGISSYSVEYWKDGLFYQSGRKDPIRLNSAGTAAYDELQKNSDVEFNENWESGGWTESKSPQDPCPPGYKVPASNIWRNEPSSGLMETISTYSLTEVYPYEVVSSNIQDAILYPYFGYLDSAGNLSKTHKNNKSQDVYGDGPVESRAIQLYFSTLNGSTHKSQPSSPAKLVTAVKYDIYDAHSLGYLKGSSDDIIEYGYKKDGFTPISYTYNECGWKSNFLGRWSANYNDVKKTLVLDANQIKSYLTDSEISTINIMIAADNLSFLTTTPYLEAKTSVSNAAYNIRCVKE